MMVDAVGVGAARQYAAQLLGGPILEAESNPTATTTTAVLIDGNGDRVALVVVNMGANDVFISIGPDVSSSKGIRLGANGGNITMDVTRDFTLPSRRWYMLASAATSALYVLEMTRFSAG